MLMDPSDAPCCALPKAIVGHLSASTSPHEKLRAMPYRALATVPTVLGGCNMEPKTNERDTLLGKVP